MPATQTTAAPTIRVLPAREGVQPYHCGAGLSDDPPTWYVVGRWASNGRVYSRCLREATDRCNPPQVDPADCAWADHWRSGHGLTGGAGAVRDLALVWANSYYDAEQEYKRLMPARTRRSRKAA